ncbi:MAG TPA: DUF167 family protein [Methylomirabilota bacterium]|nr:DUF167 family protein [Methylomirabilota bacterium]
MSPSTSFPWQTTAEGLIVRVHLQPRAARDRLLGLHGGALKIALTAPPVDNAANTALLSFLAELVQVPRSALTIISGVKSREKRVRIASPVPHTLSERLQQHLTRVDKKNLDG